MESSPRGVTLFVYGTLLRGQANHRLLAGARFLRAAATVPAYDLADLGPYPALVPGGGTAIAGELYAVPRATLAALDAFEGHPSFYRRGRVRLRDGTFASAYLLRPDQAAGFARIPCGSWAGRTAAYFVPAPSPG
jgi:gamma-glutamylaminecyclotransferase